MSKTSPKLNHSRTLNLFAKDVANDIALNESVKPTSKQKKFCYYLQKLCEENNIDKIEPQNSRYLYTVAIDKMIKNLAKAGVIIETNYQKEASEFDMDWNDPKEIMPKEHPITNDAIKKAIKNRYRVRNPKTKSEMVKVWLCAGGNWFSTAVTVNGKFVFDNKSDAGAQIKGWLPI